MSSNSAAVQIDAVTKTYDDVTAVDGISLAIQDEEFLTLLGPSGAGKTTLLHMIAGFTTPSEGAIYLDGEEVTRTPPYERNIGMVFQSMALFPHMTVGENIAFPLEMRRFDPREIEERVQEMLDLIRLPDIADRNINELSGGQQQRVAIARALAFEPSLLLLDEPLSSLDKKLREEMRRELLRIHRETNVTTVHVTHNQEEALTMADRIAVINDGHIAQHGPTEELYSQPNSAFVAEFIGDTSFLDGHVIERTATGCIVRVGNPGIELYCQFDSSKTEIDIGTDVRVGIRGERIQINNSLATQNTLKGTVDNVQFVGDTITYDVELVDLAEQQLSVTALNTTKTALYSRGETVQIGWEPEDAFIFI